MKKGLYQFKNQLKLIFISQLLFSLPVFGEVVEGSNLSDISTLPTPENAAMVGDNWETAKCYYDDGLDQEHPANVDPHQGVYELPSVSGVWLPDDPVLFRPFMADPREIVFSGGWRFDDRVLNQNVIDVSFGDSVALYRWFDVAPWGGELQIEIEGALWAVFDPLEYSSPLINADYYGGVPITYAFDNWSFRLRLYHISSHLGDEFLLNHPGYDRRNMSNEYIDFFISNDFTEEIRLYAGLGYIVGQDDEFVMSPFYSALGLELRLLRLGIVNEADGLYGCPIYAMYFRQNGDFKRHVDSTFILGYEFGKTVGVYRKLRFFMEYHDGYSLEGQFSKEPTHYFSVRTSYGY